MEDNQSQSLKKLSWFKSHIGLPKVHNDVQWQQSFNQCCKDLDDMGVDGFNVLCRELGL